MRRFADALITTLYIKPMLSSLQNWQNQCIGIFTSARFSDDSARHEAALVSALENQTEPALADWGEQYEIKGLSLTARFAILLTKFSANAPTPTRI